MKSITLFLLLVLFSVAFVASAEVFTTDYTVSTNTPTPVYTVGQAFKVTSYTALGATGNITVQRVHKGYTNTLIVVSNAVGFVASNWPVFAAGDTILVSGGGHGAIVSLEGTR